MHAVPTRIWVVSQPLTSGPRLGSETLPPGSQAVAATRTIDKILKNGGRDTVVASDDARGVAVLCSDTHRDKCQALVFVCTGAVQQYPERCVPNPPQSVGVTLLRRIPMALSSHAENPWENSRSHHTLHRAEHSRSVVDSTQPNAAKPQGHCGLVTFRSTRRASRVLDAHGSSSPPHASFDRDHVDVRTQIRRERLGAHQNRLGLGRRPPTLWCSWGR